MKMKIAINIILALCILYCFQNFLESMLELELILFTINTRIVVKEMFLNIRIMFIMCNVKWE